MNETGEPLATDSLSPIDLRAFANTGGRDSPEQSDSFSDDLSIDYDTELETEIRAIEQASYAASSGIDHPASVLRSTNHNALFDSSFSVSLSQNSSFEEKLVESVEGVLSQARAGGRARRRRSQERISRTHTEVKIESESGIETGSGSARDSESESRRQTENEGEKMANQFTKLQTSLYKAFRKRGFFSVTDLVSPLWCEVQYDYRLRSKPYLPVSKRPTSIFTDKGKEIKLNKVIARNSEKVMAKGEVVHKKLEKEIHPVEVKVTTQTKEDTWGLRLLNMIANLEALLTIGKCREFPVVGFVKGYMVVGVIDELVRKPSFSASKMKQSLKMAETHTELDDSNKISPPLRSVAKNTSPNKSSKLGPLPSSQSVQSSLTSFFPLQPNEEKLAKDSRRRTHSLFVSDSKTRSTGTMPKEENAQSGKYQLMLYKELLDEILVAALRDGPSQNPDGGSEDVEDMAETSVNPFSWSSLWSHLSLDPTKTFSTSFLTESQQFILSNELGHGMSSARNLDDLANAWSGYVRTLGLGSFDPNYATRKQDNAKVGRSEKLLELVYRTTSSKPLNKKRKSSGATRLRETRRGTRSFKSSGGNSQRTTNEDGHVLVLEDVKINSAEEEEQRLIQMAIEASLEDLIESKLQTRPAISEKKTEPDPTQVMGMSMDPTAYVRASQGDSETIDLTVEEVLQPGIRSIRLPTQEIGSPAQLTTVAEPPPQPDATTIPSPESPPLGDGEIIGTIRFTHSSSLLSAHLSSVLSFWHGDRPPIGVPVEHVDRCKWCEFEDGCEWRASKAEEARVKTT